MKDGLMSPLLIGESKSVVILKKDVAMGVQSSITYMEEEM